MAGIHAWKGGSLLTTHSSPLTIHHSPFTTHHSPLTTHHSPKASPHAHHPLHVQRWEFPADANCMGINDQYMFGPDYLVAPVTTQGATVRPAHANVIRTPRVSTGSTGSTGPNGFIGSTGSIEPTGSKLRRSPRSIVHCFAMAPWLLYEYDLMGP